MDRFEEAKQRVKEATDLVALIESYLPLRSRGRNLVALCPFHAEKTPSFTVFPDTQHFHCFGCGKAGDVFTFVMEREGVSFREAFEMLAEKAGVPLAGVFGKERRSENRVDVHKVLAEVRAFFQKCLQTVEGERALAYLEERGLAAAVEPFSLGYHPWQDGPGAGPLQALARERKLPLHVLEDAGLIKRGREIFAGRLIFPIEDERGRVVGFGGRLIPGTPAEETRGDYVPPKYLNSPESPHFNKRRVLFGLRHAKQAGTRRIAVMEGYTDVIACHLAGFTGAVATLGTALTRDHARMLERYATEGVVLLFDGDRAGRQAAERAVRELVHSTLPVSIALLEEGRDPADLVAADAGGVAGLTSVLDTAEDSMTMWFRLLRSRMDLNQAVNVERAARECATILQAVENPVRREALQVEMARHLGVPPTSLRRMLRSPAAGRSRTAEGSEGAGPQRPDLQRLDGAQKADLELLACVLAHPALGGRASATPTGWAPAGELLELVDEGVAHGKTTTESLTAWLFTRCAERAELKDVLAEAVVRARHIVEPAEFFQTLEAGRRAFAARRQAKETRLRLQRALAEGDRAAADELYRQYLQQMRDKGLSLSS